MYTKCSLSSSECFWVDLVDRIAVILGSSKVTQLAVFKLLEKELDFVP